MCQGASRGMCFSVTGLGIIAGSVNDLARLGVIGPVKQTACTTACTKGTKGQANRMGDPESRMRNASSRQLAAEQIRSRRIPFIPCSQTLRHHLNLAARPLPM